MTAPKQADSVSIADYLAGEELSGAKHEYLVEKRDAYHTIPSLKVLIFVDPDSPSSATPV